MLEILLACTAYQICDAINGSLDGQFALAVTRIFHAEGPPFSYAAIVILSFISES